MPDAVVVGSGPNGLAAANILAGSGWSVVVLEAAAEPGGSVRTGELTAPGFRHDLFSAFYPLAKVSPVFARMGLDRFGLRWRHAPVALAHPLPDGRCAWVSADADATAAGFESFAPGDGAAWLRMIDEWDRIAEPLISAIMSPFPPLRPAGAVLRRLGPLGTLRTVRHALLPVRRMAEEIFGGEGAALLLGGSALHTDISPESAGSGLYGWLLCCLAQRAGFPVPEGGAGALTSALVTRLHSLGGQVVCNATVDKIEVRGGRAVAARVRGGGSFEAGRAVLADVSAPALYRNLVGEEHLPPGFVMDLARFHWDLATVKVDWALSRPVPWAAVAAAEAGTVHVADDFNNLTEFAAHVAMGLLPSRPFLLFGQQSRADPSRSPAGTETAWAYTHVPRRVIGDAGGEIDVGGPGEPWLAGFVDRIEARIERLAPGFQSSVVGRHVFGPAALEAANANLDLGAIGAGTAQLHQQMIYRPVPGFGRAETPIAGLYLASASAHPGPGVHGAPGANAARAALLGMKRARAAVLGRGGVRSAPGRSS